MRITIKDDFNLNKIINSGQCFRAQENNNGSAMFITGNKLIQLKQIEKNQYELSCSKEEWKNFWFNYFDLNRNYKEIRIKESNKNRYVDKALDYGKGLRILKQDPWETLISFIISQNKNIPAIKRSIELLCQNFGKPLLFNNSCYYSFPTAKDLSKISEKDLENLSLGYRVPYVIDAINKVNNNEVNLIKINNLSDFELIEELKKIKGIGDKVANCISLFAYSRTSTVPEDIWIKRFISDYCNGQSPFKEFGNNAGIIQQFIFYYMRKTKVL